MSSRIRIAYILAPSHSGSTLLAFLLGAHPDATTVGDTAGTTRRQDPAYRCSCGEVARTCSFWKRVSSEMVAQGFDFSVGDFGTRFESSRSRWGNRLLHAEHRGRFLEVVRDTVLWFGPGWRQEFREIAARNAALAGTVLRITSAKVLADSSKLPHRLKFLLRIPELDIKVIHLVRDGRGVVHTCIRDNRWSVAKSAMEWRRGIRAAEKLLSRLPVSQWTQVRYEDLCADPRKTLEQLCMFVELDPSGVTLDFRSASLHVFGNKMRLDSTSEIRLDERWKTDLTQAEVAEVNRICGHLLRRYGYALDGALRPSGEPPPHAAC